MQCLSDKIFSTRRRINYQIVFVKLDSCKNVVTVIKVSDIVVILMVTSCNNMYSYYYFGTLVNVVFESIVIFDSIESSQVPSWQLKANRQKLCNIRKYPGMRVSSYRRHRGESRNYLEEKQNKKEKENSISCLMHTAQMCIYFPLLHLADLTHYFHARTPYATLLRHLGHATPTTRIKLTCFGQTFVVDNVRIESNVHMRFMLSAYFRLKSKSNCGTIETLKNERKVNEFRGGGGGERKSRKKKKKYICRTTVQKHRIYSRRLYASKRKKNDK